MSDDELLYAMGATLRDGVDLHTDLWDRLAAGEVDDAELAALRADPDPEVQAALLAFAPLTEAEVDRLEAVARDALDKDRPAKVIPFRRRRWIIGGAIAALAAGLLFFALRPSTTTPRAALPAYGIEVIGGDRAVRSEDAPLPERVLRPDSQLQITLRPPSPVDTVHAAAFLVGDRVLPVTARPLVAPSGVIIYEGRADEILGSPPAGRYMLTVILTPDTPASTPDAAGQRIEIPLRWIP